ncbi:site-specific integrase, partial [Streptococcus pneumoniae]|uniref:site-specific integrase n=1 Tax=Streptococcus pneumoniae TaxID=1313 RepID=UPI0018B05BEA
RLSHIEEPWLPWPVLVGFNGVRTEEVCLGKNAGARKDCVRWEDFDWANNELCIRAEVAKTGCPRRIELHKNTVAWLAPWRDAGATGPVT